MATSETQRVPMQARAQRTRAKLVAAAGEMFSQNGYQKTTAKSIASAAGVSTGSFYQYFSDKDAVLRELAIARQRILKDGVLTRVDAHRGPADAAIDRDDPTTLLGLIKAQLSEVVQATVHFHRADPGLHEVVTERRHQDAELDAEITRNEQELIAAIAGLLTHWWSAASPSAKADRDAEATAFVLFGMVEGCVHAHVLGHPVVDDDRLLRALVRALVAVALPGPSLSPTSQDPRSPS